MTPKEVLYGAVIFFFLSVLGTYLSMFTPIDF